MTGLEHAQARFEAGDYAAAREAALAALGDDPDSPELLQLAGRAGVEIGDGGAVEQLRRVTELTPDNAEAWRDLGDALATEGRTDEAGEAFRRALDIDPDDEVALTAAGHSAFAGGQRDDGVALLERAAEQAPGASTAAINLVDMYRVLGKPDQALEAARRISDAAPDDPLAALDVATLSLELGHNDDAVSAFERLRETVDLPEQEVAALHGLVKAELARGDTQAALGYAREARAIDTVGRTRGVLAHLEAETGGDEALQALARDASAAMLAAIEAPPTREEVEAALDASLAELRRDWSRDVSGAARG